MPPTPSGKVVITLDDGRVLSLPQTLSGSGARYANADESVVAWNKGDELMFEENGTSTYLGCIASSTQR
jgi:membrane-bound inhibitor of C-type lysozyme